MTPDAKDKIDDAGAGDGVPADFKLDWERITPARIEVKATRAGKLFHSHVMTIHSAPVRQEFAAEVSKKLKNQFGITLEKGLIENELMKIADAADKASEAAEKDPEARGEEAAMYYIVPASDPEWGGMYRRTFDRVVQLSNFEAQIVGEIIKDDGVEQHRAFEIEARLPQRTTRFIIPAAQFDAMNWVTEFLGARAVVFAGQGTKDHCRAAIQLLSTGVTTQSQYTHLGWRNRDGRWVYVHAGGAIGAIHDDVSDVQVSLTAPLNDFLLPEPNMGRQLIEAIQASLRVLTLAPPRVMFPLYAAIFRAAIGGCTDFSLHIAGRTGAGKSELAAVIQQHFGRSLDARQLPANWISSANCNGELAFLCKDAILVVDDFAPGGSAYDVQKKHGEADRLLRGQGNSAGRGRMRRDTSLQPPKPPRGLILSTGEDIPRGQSLRARLLVLEVDPEDVKWDQLTKCQRDAADGQYALVLAGFLSWLAPWYENLMKQMPSKLRELREEAGASGAHKRTPAIVANLYLGLELFIEFAEDVCAISATRAERLRQQGWKALFEAAAAQKSVQSDSDPAERFIDLLIAAIASGKAYVANKDGAIPTNAESWGWRKNRESQLEPRGNLVGWIDGSDLYLEPEAAFAIVQKLGGEGGEPLAVSNRTLHKRLHERGMLVATDETRQRLTVRKTLQGKNRNVLHLRADLLGSTTIPMPKM